MTHLTSFCNRKSHFFCCQAVALSGNELRCGFQWNPDLHPKIPNMSSAIRRAIIL